MKNSIILFLGTCLISLGWLVSRSNAQPGAGELSQSLTFHASFDGQINANYAKGDGYLYTAKSFKDLHQAEAGLGNPNIQISAGKGRYGDALDFKKKNEMAVFYKGGNNLSYSSEEWSGTVSFWLSLDPAQDLEPGYCDPIQITDAAWNDGALWVDFDQDPRDFRLGIFGDLENWNPGGDTAIASKVFENRVVTVKEPPFGKNEWTHVVFTFSGLNSGKGVGNLYLNGEHQGTTESIGESFLWDVSKAAIRLGISYVGLFDDLALFDRVLSGKEVANLYNLKGGVADLY